MSKDLARGRQVFVEGNGESINKDIVWGGGQRERKLARSKQKLCLEEANDQRLAPRRF